MSVSLRRVWPKKARSLVLLVMSTSASSGRDATLAGKGVLGTRLAKKLSTRMEDRPPAFVWL